MKKNLLIIALLLVVFLAFKYFNNRNKEKTELKENSALILESLKNVSKLVVTEAKFTEVFNYSNSKELLGKYITSDKKALVVVNADVTVSYDLSKMTYEIDEENKILKILSIPEPEMKISPDFEYYDVQSDYFNKFDANDYNEIKDRVTAKLKTKIEASDLRKNSKDRLFTELTKFYILTNSMGWTLQYEENTVTDMDALKKLKL